MNEQAIRDATGEGRTLHRKLADSIGNPGTVWCRKCERSQKVNAAKCLASGWPLCCGETMTIDAPSPLPTKAKSAP